MQNKTMTMLAQLGRADYLLGTVEELLRKGLNKRKNKVVLDVTEDGRLDLTALPSWQKFSSDVHSFFSRVFREARLDIISVLLKHLKLSPSTLFDLCRLPTSAGNFPLVDLVFKREPTLPTGVHPNTVFQTVLTAIESQSLDLVRHFMGMIDVHAADAGGFHLVRAAIAGRPPAPSDPNQTRRVGDIDILKFVIAQGAQVHNVHPGFQQTPVQMAIGGRNVEMVKLIVDSYPEGTPCDLRAECARVTARWAPFPVGEFAADWLLEVGLLG